MLKRHFLPFVSLWRSTFRSYIMPRSFRWFGACLIVLASSFVSGSAPRGTRTGNKTGAGTRRSLESRPPRNQIRDTNFIRQAAEVENRYSFIRYTRNELLLGNERPDFLSLLAEADHRKINILHLGDSHIQADVYTGTIRTRLQELFGNAGRGFLFPCRVAKSNNPDDYTTACTGVWTSTKCTVALPTEPLGVSGFAVRTEDSGATVTVKFRNAAQRPQGNLLTVWAQPGAERYSPVVVLPDSAETLVQPNMEASLPGYWVFTLPTPVTQGFTLKVLKTHPEQNSFVLNGFTLENADSAGILYHAAGVNGAKIVHYLHSPLLDEQLRNLTPDLILLDVGVNDYYTARTLPGYVADSLTALIDRVQAAAPRASILLCSQQPNMRGKRTVGGARRYSELISSIAESRPRVFAYDFYAVADTPHAVMRWRQAGLMSKDGIHLTRDGYRYKGQLFTNALLNAYRQTLNR